MTTDSDYYIAWDGMRYPGEPPADWFLAADNRWWPPREVIDGAADQADTPPPPVSNPPITQSHSSAPAPDSWAPDSNDMLNRAPTEPARRQTAAPVSRRPQRSRKGGRSRGFGFIIFLVIAFGRCTANSFDDGADQDLPDITVPALPTTTEPFDPDIAVTIPPTTQDLSAGTQLDQEAGPVVTSPDRILTDDLEARLFQCSGQGDVSGTITNRGPEALSFAIDVQIEYLLADGGNTEIERRTEQVTVGPVEPLQTSEWSLEAGEEGGLIVGCTFESVATSGSS